MAQIDIKEATIKIFDGTLGATTVDCTNADSDLTFTSKSKHIGSDKISITYVDPATASAALSVAVDGREITVNLATSTASAITSTAAEVKTAIEASSPANALVTVTFAETVGAGIVEAKTVATLNGQLSVDIKVGEGNFTYSDKKPRIFTRDRGSLDTVKNDDDEPMDVSFDLIWEWITAETGGTPTVEDAFKKRGEAAAWLTTADDACQPYSIDLEIHNAPGCGTADDEILIFEEFYYEDISHDLSEGTASVTGRCNRVEPTTRRVAAADIP